jgi:hypothetical protein
MLNLAGALADRVVVNLVTPGMVARMKELVLTGAAEASRPAPPLAVWVLAGSHGYAGRRAGSMLSTYLNAAGYRSRLEEMSMAGLIRTDPVQAVARLGILELAELSERLAELQSAGADEVALVMSGGDPVVDLWIERLAGQGWVTDA